MPESVPPIFDLLAHPIRWGLVAALTRSDYRAGELVAQVGETPNLVSYHLKKLQQAQVIHGRRSSADSRDLYYHLDTTRLHALYAAGGMALHLNPTTQPAELAPARVLFLCTHNSARSQMAEALLRQMSAGRVRADSAGSETRAIHPLAIQVMDERGLDIRAQRSKQLNEFAGQRFDRVITVCDRVREVCPTFPGKPETSHWSLPDPAEVTGAKRQLAAFRDTAQQLTARIEFLLTTFPVSAHQN
ncbi:MAG: helix-turn-helix domain-containing protein [Anaerolineales bacterium]|nr:helix-turn-helix domain-containing protein [Anaerolineales bacterium]